MVGLGAPAARIHTRAGRHHPADVRPRPPAPSTPHRIVAPSLGRPPADRLPPPLLTAASTVDGVAAWPPGGLTVTQSAARSPNRRRVHPIGGRSRGESAGGRRWEY